ASRAMTRRKTRRNIGSLSDLTARSGNGPIALRCATIDIPASVTRKPAFEFGIRVRSERGADEPAGLRAITAALPQRIGEVELDVGARTRAGAGRVECLLQRDRGGGRIVRVELRRADQRERVRVVGVRGTETAELDRGGAPEIGQRFRGCFTARK